MLIWLIKTKSWWRQIGTNQHSSRGFMVVLSYLVTNWCSRALRFSILSGSISTPYVDFWEPPYCREMRMTEYRWYEKEGGVIRYFQSNLWLSTKFRSVGPGGSVHFWGRLIWKGRREEEKAFQSPQRHWIPLAFFLVSTWLAPCFRVVPGFPIEVCEAYQHPKIPPCGSERRAIA